MQKFNIGQKVSHNDAVYVQECEIVEYYPNSYLDPIGSTPFLHSVDSYKVKFADENTAIVPESCLSEIQIMDVVKGVAGVNYSGTVNIPAMIWIPVENPPEPGTECLVCNKEGSVCVEGYFNGAFRYIENECYGLEDNNVTHWMPIPKPPVVEG